MEVKLHSFLTLALDGGELSASVPVEDRAPLPIQEEDLCV
jgi:hypothetical protein